jgi:hypothetical protein
MAPRSENPGRSPPMSRVACGVLALFAFVPLLVVQFNVPWGTVEAGGSFGSAERTARTWGEDQSASAFGFSGSDSKGWYEGDWEDEEQNAVNQLRIAAPLLAAGAVAVLVGAVLALAMPGGSGPIVTLVGGVLTGAAAAMYFVAIDDLYNADAAWDVGFYVTVGGAVVALVGGVVGLIGGARRTA